MVSGVKAPSAMSKAECVRELTQFHVAFTADMTIPELRSLVKKNRIQEGLMIDRRSQDTSLMGQIEKASLRDLRKIAIDNQVGHPASMEHGALRLHMRQWLLRSGKDETLMSLGRHKGKPFVDIWQVDAQYVQWCVRETASHTHAGWGLVQLAAWGILTGKTEDPFDEEMVKTNVQDKSLPPTCLAAVMMLDDDMFKRKAESSSVPTLNLTSEKKKEVKGYHQENSDLRQEVMMLRQEIRAMKEAQANTSSPRDRKAVREQEKP